MTDTLWYPNYLGVLDDGSAYTYDYEQAAEILQAAGYIDSNHDGQLEKYGMPDLEVRILVNKKNATRTAAARLIATALENLGFQAEIRALGAKEYQAAIKKGDFDILLTGYSMEENYDLREFFNGKNPWKYTNYMLLKQVNELERLHTEEEYREIYREIKAQLAGELPYEPLCYKYIGLIGLTNFEADQLPMFQDIYKNCQTWRWYKVIEPEKDAAADKTENKNENNENN